ncbi:threonine synthase [Collinsella sp. AGMB00827]|uniref:Threonine synthase n=1 Tax=Collinsella ureilytica TaxID=2869515 RepID=A0ABS7MHY0_9ACTN|nr:threonine synthase [Collinsella urealyticum]MBY4796918.1 threonine synthase [Collinsella urealyticum]
MASYHSTRSSSHTCSSREAVRQGLAPDGGLYVSDSLGQTKIDVKGLANRSYTDLAREIIALLLPDYTADEIAACVDEAYTNTFSSPELTPIHRVGELADSEAPLYSLELFHGSTSAFKDVALQMLPRLMARTTPVPAKTVPGDMPEQRSSEAPTERIMIVTATSGDTGKAALAGFADAPGTGICVFYPEGKVSRVQELQMTTQQGSNVAVSAVRGTFDDAQSAVKAIFADTELAERLRAENIVLSSANSINIGRLVPQVVYYFAAYAQLVRAEAIKPGDAVEFCVPTGNFGDILAGYYARELGLPISQLIVASDRNNVLADFLATGTYDRRRPFFTTSSPSMDILISSNLERMLYYLSDNNCELVADLMAKLQHDGVYAIPEELLVKIRSIFSGGWASEEEVAHAIRDCYERFGYLIDPHTACAYHVLTQTQANQSSRARIMLATASPYKFPRAVAAALGLHVSEDDFECMKAVAAKTGTEAPKALAELATETPRFHDVQDIDQLGAYVEQAARMLDA